MKWSPDGVVIASRPERRDDIGAQRDRAEHKGISNSINQKPRHVQRMKPLNVISFLASTLLLAARRLRSSSLEARAHGTRETRRRRRLAIKFPCFQCINGSFVDMEILISPLRRERRMTAKNTKPLKAESTLASQQNGSIVIRNTCSSSIYYLGGGDGGKKARRGNERRATSEITISCSGRRALPAKSAPRAHSSLH